LGEPRILGEEKLKKDKEDIVNPVLISTIVVIVYLFLCSFSSYWMSGETREERIPEMFLLPMWIGPLHLLWIGVETLWRKVKR